MSLDIGRKVKANSNFDPRYSLASHTSWCTMWERFGLGGKIWKKGERKKGNLFRRVTIVVEWGLSIKIDIFHTELWNTQDMQVEVTKTFVITN